MSSPHTVDRIGWLDGARGIGIVLVVAGHAIRSVGKSVEEPPSELLALVDHAIYSFHMPLFFLLAGIAAGLAAKRTTAEALIHIFWALVVPYVVWSTITIGSKLALPGLANTKATFWDLAAIFTTPYSIYWFLYDLIIIRLAWLVIEKVGWRALDVTVIIALFVVVASGKEFGTDPFGSTLFFYSSFFASGLFVTPLAKSSGYRHAALLLLVGTAVWMLMTPWTGVQRPSSTAALAALAGSAVVIGTAMLIFTASAGAGRVIAYLGSSSLAIYVSHSLFLAVPRVLLPSLTGEDIYRDVVLSMIAGILGPLAMLYVISKASKSMRLDLNRMVGLGPLRPPIRKQEIHPACRRLSSGPR